MKNSVLLKIQEWAQQTPHHAAIVTPERTLTYEELITSAATLARDLYENEVSNGQFIGVFLTPCAELPICLLAIWMIGAAYVPLDPIYPKERIRTMLNEVNLSYILTRTQDLPLMSKTDLSLPFLDVNRCLSQHNIALQTSTYPDCPLAYLIFTSGSTGTPNGVMVTTTNLLNVLESFQARLKITPLDRLLSITPTSFDIFALELFLPLISGATCYFTNRMVALDSDMLITQLDEHRITLFQATPSTYHLLSDEIWPELALKHLLCGGEAWNSKLATHILKQKPKECTLWNVYGPTETTIWSSLYPVISPEELFITPSVDRTHFVVLDETLQPASEGELYIGGAGVSLGYYSNPNLTQERFVTLFHEDQRGLFYKTGDLVKNRGNSTYSFVGRCDSQVKIRGFRIELGEIEQALLTHPEIVRAVVLYDAINSADDKALVAFLETKDITRPPLREFLSNTLPSYMIPQFFLYFDSLPLSPNLKIDKKSLLRSAVNCL